MKELLEELKAIHTSDGVYSIPLSNGKEIKIIEHPILNGSEWDWKVDSQYFSVDKFACKYLKRLISEELTGKRIIYRAKGTCPDICGTDGSACRAPGECNRALCDRCPVAEAFFAERDGAELIYAVNN